eukprot:SAG31_NODE_5138_length_2719_cov_50.811832_3_plen_152_part_00
MKVVAEESSQAAAAANAERDQLAESLHELSIGIDRSSLLSATGQGQAEATSASNPVSIVAQAQPQSVREELEISLRMHTEARIAVFETELSACQQSMVEREERFAAEKKQALDAAGSRVRPHSFVYEAHDLELVDSLGCSMDEGAETSTEC